MTVPPDPPPQLPNGPVPPPPLPQPRTQLGTCRLPRTGLPAAWISLITGIIGLVRQRRRAA